MTEECQPQLLNRSNWIWEFYVGTTSQRALCIDSHFVNGLRQFRQQQTMANKTEPDLARLRHRKPTVCRPKTGLFCGINLGSARTSTTISFLIHDICLRYRRSSCDSPTYEMRSCTHNELDLPHRCQLIE